MTATKQQMRDELRQRRFVGDFMSNILWNVEHSNLTTWAPIAGEWRKKWDAIQKGDIGTYVTVKREKVKSNG